MSEATIRQTIFETIAGEQGLVEPFHASAQFGMVHKYERWSGDWSAFLAMFKDPSTGRIFGCEITRTGRPTEKLDGQEELRTHVYKIKGYLGLEDTSATELLFNERIEALADLFKHNHTLNNTAHDAGPVTVEVIEARMFGTVLCHYAELRLPVVEIQ